MGFFLKAIKRSFLMTIFFIVFIAIFSTTVYMSYKVVGLVNVHYGTKNATILGGVLTTFNAMFFLVVWRTGQYKLIEGRESCHCD